MIVHNVLFKLNDRSRENIERVREALLGMAGRIEGMRDFRVEIDFLHAEPSYDLGLFATFETKTDFETYLPHPVHRGILKDIEGSLAALAIVSYEG